MYWVTLFVGIAWAVIAMTVSFVALYAIVQTLTREQDVRYALFYLVANSVVIAIVLTALVAISVSIRSHS